MSGGPWDDYADTSTADDEAGPWNEYEAPGAPATRVTGRRDTMLRRKPVDDLGEDLTRPAGTLGDIPAGPVEAPPPPLAPTTPTPALKRRRDTMLRPNAPQIDDDLSAPVGSLGQPMMPPRIDAAGPSWSDVGTGLVDALTGTAKYVTGAPGANGVPEPGLANDLAASAFRASGGVAGVARAAGEQMRNLPPIPGLNMVPNKVLDAANTWLGDQAHTASETAKRISPPQPEGSLRGMVSSGVQSAGQSALMMPAAIATGNPMMMLAPMSALQGGESYQRAREAGNSPGKSLGYGASDAVIEFATERLPGIRLLTDLRAGTPILKTVLHNLATEVPGEQVATILQDLNEWAVLNAPRGKTFMDYVAERPSAALSTLVSTLVSSGMTGATVQMGRTLAPKPEVRADQAVQQQDEQGADPASALVAALEAQPLYDQRSMNALRRQQTEQFNQEQEAANAGSPQPTAVPPGGGQPAPQPGFAESNFQVPGTVVPGAPSLGAAPDPAVAPIPSAPGGLGNGPESAVVGPWEEYLPTTDDPTAAGVGAPTAASEPVPAAVATAPEPAAAIPEPVTSGPTGKLVPEPTVQPAVAAPAPAAAALPPLPAESPPKLIEAHTTALKAGAPTQDTLAAMKASYAHLEAKFNAGDATGTDIGNMNALEYHIQKAEKAAAPQRSPLSEDEHLKKVLHSTADETSGADLLKAALYAQKTGNTDALDEVVKTAVAKFHSPQPLGEMVAIKQVLEMAAPTPPKEAPNATAPSPTGTPGPAAAPAAAAPPTGPTKQPYAAKPKPAPAGVPVQGQPAKGGGVALTAGGVQPAGGKQYAAKTPYAPSTVVPSPVSQQPAAQGTLKAEKTPTVLVNLKNELSDLWKDKNLPAAAKADPAKQLKTNTRTHALWAATAKDATVPDANLVHALDWADSHSRSDLAKQIRKRGAARIKAGTASDELKARMAKPDPFKGKVTHSSPGVSTGTGTTKVGKGSGTTSNPILYGEAQPGGQLAKHIPPTNANFWKWFGASKLVDDKGNPIVYYHGSTKSGGTISTFDQGHQGHAIFAAPNIAMGKHYAGWSSKGDETALTHPSAGSEYFYPVYIRAENPWDWENSKHVNDIVQRVAAAQGKGPKDYLKVKGEAVSQSNLKAKLSEGYWPWIESPEVLDAIHAAQHDGYFTFEMQGKNVAVFSAHQLKSAVKNSGGFSIEDPSQFAEQGLPEYDDEEVAEAREQAGADETTAQDSNQPKTKHVGQTRRASNYNDAWYDAGIEPGVGVSMPFAKQFQTLRGLWSTKYGIDVKLGKAPKKWETTAQMLDGYRNVGYMMSLLGLPVKAAGLDGTLKLRLDKMKPGELGSFNALTKVMEMPGRSNSFAHEYGHAVDNFIFERLGLNQTGKTGWLSQYAAGKGLHPDIQQMPEHLRPLAQSFATLMNALHKDELALAAEVLKLQNLASQQNPDGTPTAAAYKAKALLLEISGGKQAASKTTAQTTFVKNAQMADKQGGSNYWRKPAELLARSFEAYVAHLSANAQKTLTGLGIEQADEFITKGERAYLSDGSEQFAKMYPKEAERQGIFLAWHDVIDALRAAELLGHKGDELDVAESVLKEQAGPRHEKEGTAVGRLFKRELGSWKKDQTAPTNPATNLSWSRRLDRSAMGLYETGLQTTGSMQGLLSFYQARTGSASLAKLNRMLFRTIGKVGERNQNVGGIFEDEHQHTQSQNTRLQKLERELFGIGHTYSHAEDTYLRHVLTGQGEMTDADVKEMIAAAPHQGLDETTRKKLNELALFMRKVLTKQLDIQQENGVPVKEAESFLSRQYNRHAILDDPEGFVRDAHKVYAIEFDRSVGTSPSTFKQDAYNEALERLGFTSKSDGAMSHDAAQFARQLATQQAALRALQAQRKAAVAAGLDPSDIQDKIDEKQEQIDQTIEDLLPLMREDYGQKLAEDWLHRMRTPGRQQAHAKAGPNASFTKHRALPREADTLLARFMEGNVPALVREYVEKSTKKAMYAKYFGHDDAKLDALIDQMADEGVTPEMIEEIRKVVDNATGRLPSSLPSKFEAAASTVRMLGTFTLLARSAWASMAEPLQLALHTGNLWDSTRLVGGVLRSTFSRANADDFRQIGERLGIVTLAFTSNPTMDHNVNEHFAKKQGKMYGQFFTLSGLTPLTNWQRTQVVMPGGMQFLADLLRKPEHQGSRKELAQWGIPEDRQKEVAAWLDKLKGNPKVDDLVDPNTDLIWDETSPAGLYARALRAIVTHTVTEPYKIDRPFLAGNPVAQTTFALTGFAYGHWAKFYKPILRKLATGMDTVVRGEAANDLGMGRLEAAWKTVVPLAAASAAFYAATFVFSLIRELLYNFAKWTDDDWDEKKKGSKVEALMWLALDRTGFWGPFDPLKQALMGTKYQRSLAESLAGPYLGNTLTNIDAVWKGMTQPTPGNVHKAVRAFLMLSVGNALGLAQATAPGPISGVLAAVMNQFLGTQAVAGWAAGELGAPKPDKKGGGASKKPPTFKENAQGELVQVPKTKKQTFVEGPDGKLVAVPKGKKKVRFVENARGQMVAAP